MTSRWNHNIHYHPVILGALPNHCRRVLDVGCGEGTLARQLRTIAPEVTAIDLDPASIDLARHHDHRAPRDGGPINYVLADFLTHPFENNSFDAIVSVAALHHMNPIAALARMRDLLRPGGTLAIIGLARSQLPADLPIELAAAIGERGKPWEAKLRARLACDSSAGELLVEHPDADSIAALDSSTYPQLSAASHGLPRSPTTSGRCHRPALSSAEEPDHQRRSRLTRSAQDPVRILVTGPVVNCLPRFPGLAVRWWGGGGTVTSVGGDSRGQTRYQWG